ncbi:phosphatase PAP2 family protein [Shewanella sp. SHSM-M6]|uniref:Phosphatase PAP2 family protein n=1 Tax=Shewanella salipaludis TaxID=2723052 RepID=A0A972JLM9_9GAMM|nr:phosphatase PAP2 family protein [Shewanella salipaludis]
MLGACLLQSTILAACMPLAAQAKSSTEQQGESLRLAIPAIALGATLFYEEGYDGSLQFFESLATNELTTYALKQAIDTRRPNGDCCNSFPSGHASTAFMGAAFIHRRYGWEYAVPAYLGAAYVGYTRVDADKHYTRDVVAGAVIGIASSFYFTEPYEGVKITPYAADGSYGIMFSGHW